MDQSIEPEEPNTSSVGYCKPPRHTRFTRGNSGNPRGRPKGTLNLATVLTRALCEKVIISQDGQRKAVTKLEAAVGQLVNKATAGDLRALRHLADLVISTEKRASQAPAPIAVLSKEDEKVIQGMMERFRLDFTEGENESHSK